MRGRTVFEFAALLAEYRRSRDVRRHEVVRKLDSPEARAETGGQRAHQHRFADAGNVLKQQMPAAEHRHQRQPDLFLFADNDRADAVNDPFKQLGSKIPMR